MMIFIARPPDMTKIKKFRPTHMNGMCVDVTLTDKEGNEIEMPSPFDIMDERASLNYSGHSETGRRKRRVFEKQVMESVGFQAYECEWWHFYDVSTDPAPFSDYFRMRKNESVLIFKLLMGSISAIMLPFFITF